MVLKSHTNATLKVISHYQIVKTKFSNYYVITLLVLVSAICDTLYIYSSEIVLSQFCDTDTLQNTS